MGISSCIVSGEQWSGPQCLLEPLSSSGVFFFFLDGEASSPVRAYAPALESQGLCYDFSTGACQGFSTNFISHKGLQYSHGSWVITAQEKRALESAIEHSFELDPSGDQQSCITRLISGRSFQRPGYLASKIHRAPLSAEPFA